MPTKLPKSNHSRLVVDLELGNEDFTIDRGYILLPRSIADQWFYQEKPFSKGQAIIDLMLKAAYMPYSFRAKDGFVDLKRGEISITYEALASDWGWKTSNAKRFIYKLRDQGILSLRSSRKRTIIFLDFFENSQGSRTTNGTKLAPISEPKKSRKSDTLQLIDKQTNKSSIDLHAPKQLYGEYSNVRLSEEEYAQIQRDGLISVLERLSAYMRTKGKEYADHYTTIIEWAKADEKKAHTQQYGSLKTPRQFENHEYDMDLLQKQLLGL